ncbi:hypothetical protein ACR71G_01980 [Xenorhabdus bovienii]
MLGNHVRKSHHMTLDEYREKFSPDSTLHSSLRKKGNKQIIP